MTAGIEIKNTSGVVTIDETYANLHMVASGSVNPYTNPAGNNGSLIYWYDLTYAGSSYNQPLIFLNYTPGTANAAAGLVGCYNSGNNWIFRIAVFWNYTQNPSTGEVTVNRPSNTTVNYYIYDNPPNSTSSNGALIVYNGSGNVVFNSNYKPLVVKASVGLNTSVTGLPSNTYAFCANCILYAWESDQDYLDSNGSWSYTRIYHTDITGYRCTPTSVDIFAMSMGGTVPFDPTKYFVLSDGAMLVAKA